MQHRHDFLCQRRSVVFQSESLAHSTALPRDAIDQEHVWRPADPNGPESDLVFKMKRGAGIWNRRDTVLQPGYPDASPVLSRARLCVSPHDPTDLPHRNTILAKVA